MDSLTATGAAVTGWPYATLALAYLAAGRPAEGLGVAAKGLATPARNNDPYLYRLHGDLLLMADSANATDAETSFRAAIAAASKQSAK